MQRKSSAEKNLSPRIVCAAPFRLVKVSPLADYKLDVEFIDGTRGIVEMKYYIMSEHAGVFASLRDIKLFNNVYLQYGVASWPGEIDLAPDAMYDEITRHGKWVLK